MAGGESIYCIDTSSLVNLRSWRPAKRFPEPWKRLDHLIRQDRLLSPAVVLQELQECDDALFRWARKRKSMFKKSSPDLVEQVQEILARFPDLVDPDSPTSSADPFVAALAIREASSLYQPDIVVLTEEKYAPGRSRIPHVCEAYKLKYLTIHQMFRFEGWTF